MVRFLIVHSVKEDAEESGQRLGKGWEARVRTCIEANVSTSFPMYLPEKCPTNAFVG